METFKAGDIISCAGRTNREILECKVDGSHLRWTEKGSEPGSFLHSWPIESIILVSHKEEIVNSYDIY